MKRQAFQHGEIRDQNDAILQDGAYGKKTAFTNSQNMGILDYIINNLEVLYDGLLTAGLVIYDEEGRLVLPDEIKAALQSYVTSAGNSATAADASAQAAADSAAAADSSAKAAAGSEANVDASAKAAATAEKNSLENANAAADSKAAADASAQAAAGSATQAAASAETAGNSAASATSADISASNSASAAASSATAAAKSASEAASSATAAAGSASEAANKLSLIKTAIEDYFVGYVFYRPYLAAGHVKANGATVNRSDYPRLAQFATDHNLWTSDPTNEPWKYGVGDGSTTMVLPDYRGRVIQGGDTTALLKPGLPNITGWMHGDTFNANGTPAAIYWDSYGAISTGVVNVSNNVASHQNATAYAVASDIVFNAANSNSIYGASETVQAPALSLIPQLRY